MTRAEDAGEHEVYGRVAAPIGFSPYAQPPPRCPVHGRYMAFRAAYTDGYVCRVPDCDTRYANGR